MSCDDAASTHMAASQDFDVIYLAKLRIPACTSNLASIPDPRAIFPHSLWWMQKVKLARSKSLFGKDERAGRCLVLSEHHTLVEIIPQHYAVCKHQQRPSR